MLIPRDPQRPGRRRTVAARAWISRRKRGGVFYSNVSLGDGIRHTLTTATRNRPEALAFSLVHLLKVIREASRHRVRHHASHQQTDLAL